MLRTTVYLPEDLKAAVTREAKRCGIPEAELIRRAIQAAVDRPKPTGGLFASSEPIASRTDDLLAGFGQR
jgi:hypothetical protein